MIENSLVGVWNGTIFLPTMPIILLAHFFLNGDEMAGYLDVPTQQATKIRIDIFQNKNEKIIFNATSIDFSFYGSGENSSKLQGTINSFSTLFPIQFEKIKNVSEYAVKRPQTPKGPYNYFSEEVVVKNKKANVALSGTFTYPKNQKPIAAVVLCHGSGGQDRDETVLDHKPFKVIADYLTKNNIAVLRYDERGIRNSSGNFFKADDVDFAEDAIVGIEFLKNRKETSESRLGLVGHSKGGLTSIIASNRSSLIEFIALLGSPGVSGEEILYEQTKLILLTQNISKSTYEINLQSAYNSYSIVKNEPNDSIARLKVEEYFNTRLINATGQNKTDLENAKASILVKFNEIVSPWFRSFLVLDPATILVHTKIPVLGIWGSNDIQVPPHQNLGPMDTALKAAKNRNFKLITFDRLNHLFQNIKTGSLEEYGLIEETFSVQVLEVLKDWIVKESVILMESGIPEYVSDDEVEMEYEADCQTQRRAKQSRKWIMEEKYLN
ncbi:alpha beta hydrolase fold [Brachionus plicatilis]|uniref:Alpha beta hydrolase fold n=1 Tax=Brachionus plicatilis TaxID=10195 RepID=A0A3M7SEQ7_BRAPC|nr:alpha beta hydrolase fold [Brachionus plicatilis]